MRIDKTSYRLYMLYYVGLLLTLSLLHRIWGWELLASTEMVFAVKLVLVSVSYRRVGPPFFRLKCRFAPALTRPVW